MRLCPDLSNQIGQRAALAHPCLMKGRPHLRVSDSAKPDPISPWRPLRCCPFNRRVDLSTALVSHRGSTREPQRVPNRLKHRQVVVDSEDAVPAQHRWSIHGCLPLAMDCPLESWLQSKQEWISAKRNSLPRPIYTAKETSKMPSKPKQHHSKNLQCYAVTWEGRPWLPLHPLVNQPHHRYQQTGDAAENQMQ